MQRASLPYNYSRSVLANLQTSITAAQSCVGLLSRSHNGTLKQSRAFTKAGTSLVKHGFPSKEEPSEDGTPPGIIMVVDGLVLGRPMTPNTKQDDGFYSTSPLYFRERNIPRTSITNLGLGAASPMFPHKRVYIKCSGKGLVHQIKLPPKLTNGWLSEFSAAYNNVQPSTIRKGFIIDIRDFLY